MVRSYISVFVVLFLVLLSLGATAQEEQHMVLPNAVYVRLHKGATLQVLETIPAFVNIKTAIPLLQRKVQPMQATLTTNNATKLQRATDELERTYMLITRNVSNTGMFCEKLRRMCNAIEHAEPVYVQQVTGKFIPNDDSIMYQDLMMTKLQVYEAWDVFQGDTNVLIGISDSGILQTHEDYEGTLYHNPNEIPDNGIDDDGNGYVDDWNGVNFAFADDSTKPGNTRNTLNGHGTGVAGIASATVNNKKGVAGIGFRSRFVPMKTMPNNYNGILYGYQSIMYAAENNIKVINMSWGGGAYSCIQQSIIDYALAKGVSVVGAAGNNGNSSAFYPSAYKGVLGVGVCEPTDTIAPMSSFGSHMDIFAPGNQAFTTADEGWYLKFCCTSGAAPIVTGAVALVRGRFPELTAEQASEHVRLSTDNIEKENVLQTKYTRMIPGRINVYKAVSIDPFSHPSLVPEDWEYSINNAAVSRVIPNDTVSFSVRFKNYLGLGRNIRFVLSTAEDTANVIQVLDSVATVTSVATDSIITLSSFKFRVLKHSRAKLFFRIDMQGTGETNQPYTDFCLIPFTPFPQYTTWRNNITSFTLSDRGRIGFDSPVNGTGGVGYIYKDYCNTLFEGGLIATEQQSNRVVSTVRTNYPNYKDDFETVKPFYGTDPTVGIINDSRALDSLRIGLEISQRVVPPQDNNPFVKIITTAKNTSGKVLNDVALGYFFDFDIGEYADSNTIRFMSEVIPDNYEGRAAALLAERKTGDYPHIGVLSYTPILAAQAQAVGLENLPTYDGAGFTNDFKMQTLNSGTTMMWNGVGDISCVSGMKFLGPWQPNDTREFTTVFGADSTAHALYGRLRTILNPSLSAVSEPQNGSESLSVEIAPVPAKDIVNITIHSSASVAKVIVYSLLGNQVADCETIQVNGNTIYRLSTSELQSGTYAVVITAGGETVTMPLVVLH